MSTLLPFRAPSSVAGAVTATAMLLAFTLPLSAQLPSGFDATWSRVASSWKKSTTGAGIVGASLAFVADGGLARHETLGFADLATRRAVDEHTIYHWASITKTFTAIAIMQLRDRGLLSLDDPIIEYVPELGEVHNPYGSMEDITIRELLSHSAGFRDPTWPWGGDQPWQPFEPTEWSQLVAMMPYTQILFPSGSKYSYSNPGLIFLGRTIEKVTGDVYEAYIEKNIFRPLGMTHAYFDVTPWHLLPYRSNHYYLRDGKPEAGGLDFNTGITVSNGGLNAPIPDMARYVAFLVGSPPAGVDADIVLPRTSLEEMWHTVVPVGDSDIGRESMGLCFFLYDDDEGHHLVGHTGTQAAFLSFFIMDPASKVAAIAVSNTVSASEQGPDARALLNDVRAYVVHDVFPLFRNDDRREP